VEDYVNGQKFECGRWLPLVSDRLPSEGRIDQVIVNRDMNGIVGFITVYLEDDTPVRCSPRSSIRRDGVIYIDGVSGQYGVSIEIDFIRRSGLILFR